MCIRDRPDWLPGQHAAYASHFDPIRARAWPLSFASGRSLQSHRRCLLYTSDAADERSSVDLGGRRIIKKKQRRQCYRLDAYIKKHKD